MAKAETYKVDWNARCEKMKETGCACTGYNLKNCTFFSDGTIVDINDVLCMKLYVYDRGNGRKTAYVHYTNNVEIWDTMPGMWKGWKLGYRMYAEQ